MNEQEQPERQEDTAPTKPEPQQKPEYEFDMDSIKTQNHRWIDRGLVMSCEGAGHPYHQAYKRR